MSAAAAPNCLASPPEQRLMRQIQIDALRSFAGRTRAGRHASRKEAQRTQCVLRGALLYPLSSFAGRTRVGARRGGELGYPGRHIQGSLTELARSRSVKLDCCPSHAGQMMDGTHPRIRTNKANIRILSCHPTRPSSPSPREHYKAGLLLCDVPPPSDAHLLALFFRPYLLIVPLNHLLPLRMLLELCLEGLRDNRYRQCDHHDTTHTRHGAHCLAKTSRWNHIPVSDRTQGYD